MDEKRITNLMKSLGCTREEAISVIMEDEEIDRMSSKEITADLTPEQKKAMKDATKTGTKKRSEVKRERKVDETKKRLLDVCAKGLSDELEIVAEYENEVALHFSFEGANYELKLIKHRPPKASK